MNSAFYRHVRWSNMTWQLVVRPGRYDRRNSDRRPNRLFDFGWCRLMTDGIEARIISTIEMVCKNKGLTVTELNSDTVLNSSLGIESLDFAEIVIRLEDEFGMDPFSSGEILQVRTISDLTKIYSS